MTGSLRLGWFLGLACILLGFATTAKPQPARPANAIQSIEVRRAPTNPLITFASSPSLGDNINGPSVIRVPAWVKEPLGKYYMYFAHHHGQYIRLAYADAPEGPWTVYEPGTLRLKQAEAFNGHIASPDVHVDAEKQEIRMYFHGPTDDTGKKQETGVAVSKDGLAFEASDEILGPYYFRVFRWRGNYYAIAKDAETGWGQRLASKDGLTRFKSGGNFISLIRHGAVLVRDEQLLVFYSRKGDAPESIVVATADLKGGWKHWRESDPVYVMGPQESYEGIAYPNEPSDYGSAIRVRQLRDPCIFEDEGKTYLYYAVAGEMGIAMAELKIEMKKPDESPAPLSDR